MNTQQSQCDTDTETRADPRDIRVLILGSDKSLGAFGPMFGHLAVGLMDDVDKLTLLCQGSSRWLDHVPVPPVRLVTESRDHVSLADRLTTSSERVYIKVPRIDFLERLASSRRLERFAAAVRPYQPTLIHVLGHEEALAGRRLSRLLELPYIISILQSDVSIPLTVSDARCRGILVRSSGLARRIRLSHPNLARRVQLLPLGTHVDESPCCYAPWHPEVPAVLCCAPLEVGLGLPCLLNAAAILKSKGLTFNLVLAGRGSAARDLRRQVRKLQIESMVHFSEPFESTAVGIDSYKACFRTMDVFVQPFEANHWQAELLMAASAGAALIAVKPDAAKDDLIVPDKTARTVPFGDDMAMAQALEELLTDHPAAQAQAQRMQDHLRKHFTAVRMIGAMARAYHSALAKRQPPQ